MSPDSVTYRGCLLPTLRIKRRRTGAALSQVIVDRSSSGDALRFLGLIVSLAVAVVQQGINFTKGKPGPAGAAAWRGLKWQQCQ
jgi:hypothetical protein